MASGHLSAVASVMFGAVFVSAVPYEFDNAGAIDTDGYVINNEQAHFEIKNQFNQTLFSQTFDCAEIDSVEKRGAILGGVITDAVVSNPATPRDKASIHELVDEFLYVSKKTDEACRNAREINFDFEMPDRDRTLEIIGKAAEIIQAIAKIL